MEFLENIVLPIAIKPALPISVSHCNGFVPSRVYRVAISRLSIDGNRC
jgi:hypothetical protein